MRFLRNNSGATALEFALVFPAFLAFVLGIVHVGYVVWIDNLLHYSVETAARCSAVGSTTYPCAGSGTANMTTAAENLFQQAIARSNIPSGTFTALSPCSGSGLQGSYTVGFLLSPSEPVNSVLRFLHLAVTVTANSCYPNFTS
jgi:Flp pilus assembly protein TadG